MTMTEYEQLQEIKNQLKNQLEVESQLRSEIQELQKKRIEDYELNKKRVTKTVYENGQRTVITQVNLDDAVKDLRKMVRQEFEDRIRKAEKSKSDAEIYVNRAKAIEERAKEKLDESKKIEYRIKDLENSVRRLHDDNSYKIRLIRELESKLSKYKNQFDLIEKIKTLIKNNDGVFFSSNSTLKQIKKLLCGDQ